MLLFSCVFQWNKLPNLSNQCLGMCSALVFKKVIFKKPILTVCFLVWGKTPQHNLSVLYRDQLFLSVMQAELCKSSIFFRKCNSPSSFLCSFILPEKMKSNFNNLFYAFSHDCFARSSNLMGARLAGSHVDTQEPKTNPLVSVL